MEFLHFRSRVGDDIVVHVSAPHPKQARDEGEDMKGDVVATGVSKQKTPYATQGRPDCFTTMTDLNKKQL
jgi:hypothetical protein